jgi:hypothetical protein
MGLCYPESNPLSKGEVTIKLMTAKEEDILTSTNLIRKGIHLDKLLEYRNDLYDNNYIPFFNDLELMPVIQDNE